MINKEKIQNYAGIKNIFFKKSTRWWTFRREPVAVGTVVSDLLSWTLIAVQLQGCWKKSGFPPKRHFSPATEQVSHSRQHTHRETREGEKAHRVLELFRLCLTRFEGGCGGRAASSATSGQPQSQCFNAESIGPSGRMNVPEIHPYMTQPSTPSGMINCSQSQLLIFNSWFMSLPRRSPSWSAILRQSQWVQNAGAGGGGVCNVSGN